MPRAARLERTTRKKIRIPPGVDTGTQLRSSGDGEGGLRGGPPGDLFVVLHVRPHALFHREGDDLLFEMPISFVQAALGAEVEVPALNGAVPLQIPPGTQTGQMFRLKGKGIKNAQGYGLGDLHVRVVVEVPTHLNGAQRTKLEEFAALCDEKVNPQSRSFFEKAKKFFKQSQE
jgi:molecular chaperone DnaJ